MKKITILALCLLITACHTQRHFTNVEAPQRYKSDRKITQNSDFFIAGIGQTDTIDATQLCGGEQNVDAVETKHTFINGLVSMITLGIYYPREYTIYCKK